MLTPPGFLDRVALAMAPQWALKRARARVAVEMLGRYYDAASTGRRTQGWRRLAGDANAASSAGLTRVREYSRDLVRNNPYAASARETIVDQMVGWGIVAAKPPERWKRWAETTACDADGRQDLAGLQKQVASTVVESGEALVRRRWRRATDGLPLPIQLQVLEPDFLDHTKDQTTTGGGRIIQGVEFDSLGRRAGYWLFQDHPGSRFSSGSRIGISRRIDAADILHVFKPDRPGQVRAVSWFAPVVLRMKDFDEYEDAALMKQKIAACLAVITSDVDGTSTTVGGQPNAAEPLVDLLEPGAIINAAPGRSIDVVQPPTVSEHGEYAKTVLRAIATGLGVTYEDLTGDYTGLPFSAARMSRMRQWARVEGWRWRMLIPQFCDPVWRWANEAAAVMGEPMPSETEWTPPPMPMIDPEKEGLALQRLMRIGRLSWPEMIREGGYDPEARLREIKEWNKKFDAAGVILDSDPRKTSQQGQPRDTKKPDAGGDETGETE